MKTQIVLFMYAKLMRREEVIRRSFCEQHAISERTFYRYLGEIVHFLSRYDPGYVIDVLEPEGRYFLKERIAGEGTNGARRKSPRTAV